jgi:hypothetical protein
MQRDRCTGRQNVRIETASAEDVVDGGVRSQLQAHRSRNVRFRQAKRLRNKRQYPYPPWFVGQVKYALRNIKLGGGVDELGVGGRRCTWLCSERCKVSRPKSINGDASTCSTVCTTVKASNVGLNLCACNVSTTSNGDSSVA